jgi:hypothetical protein
MDIVERLLDLRWQIEMAKVQADRREAAAEIERLREALKHLLRWHDQLSPADIAKAKAALKEGE